MVNVIRCFIRVFVKMVCERSLFVKFFKKAFKTIICTVKY